MKRHLGRSFTLIAVSCLLIGFSSPTFAQAVEVEPNDPCEQAQDLGPIDVTGGPFAVQGSLDTPPDEPDVDFFRFSATPGAQLVADHEGQDTGAGTLPDPFLGLFDSDCNLLASNDDAVGFNSRLSFEVPPDGVLVLAASSCCDEQFTGDGGSSGTYQLTISQAPPSIGSISGRIVDARTGEPLPGNEPPFAFADLLLCEDDFCSSVNSQGADGEGRFRFDQDFNGQPLPVGTYQVVASANEYESAATDPFEVDEGEDVDIGDIPLEPPAISVSDVQPCDDLLPQGDTCLYSFQLNNNTNARIRGIAWSLVDGFDLGSSLDFTLFEASTRGGSRQAFRERLALQPFGEATLEFQFDVPPFVIGATFCTRVFVGADPSPLVTTVREAFLFCITGGATGFEVMSASESQKMFESLTGETRTSPEKRGRAR